MYPPIQQYATASEAVRTILGVNPTRLWPFGQARQNEVRPYAIYQQVYGTPENTLSCPADIDLHGIQFDGYANTPTEVRNLAEALRGAMELHGYVVALNGEDWEPSTGLWRSSFTVEFWTPRN